MFAARSLAAARAAAAAAPASGARTAVRALSSDAAAAKPTAVVSTAYRDIVEADIVSGVPPEVSRRTVRIYQPSKPATQSGTAGTHHWRLDFDSKDRWENPLMGWSSSADPVQALRIKFDTKEQAIAFAERQGYDFWVEEPKVAHKRVKSYSENFKYVPGKLRLFRTK
ncbi:ndufs4 NADH dehydrogenase Fe-S protein subunit [Polyrhizophydium stewartii]|uniref:NADH dehydrogenase [ubiquinone] iron-sulfur protein 4, mitochondrial n=1 Tax=Polyrhizophydium stewartii TaxID=2732419 RepID=A0ABR4NHW2_9FUNG|nr:hypothetical protein HK105_003541 [Polyrhizophydium stewartii]